jgi:hypothetical protein
MFVCISGGDRWQGQRALVTARCCRMPDATASSDARTFISGEVPLRPSPSRARPDPATRCGTPGWVAGRQQLGDGRDGRGRPGSVSEIAGQSPGHGRGVGRSAAGQELAAGPWPGRGGAAAGQPDNDRAVAGQGPGMAGCGRAAAGRWPGDDRQLPSH